MNDYFYYKCCSEWREDDVHSEGGLCDMVDAIKYITIGTFLKHVNRDNLQNEFGDAICFAKDKHVKYFCSVLHGQRVYGFEHSCIEYVFRKLNNG